jgi:F-type H+-transporting ATPase subunit gamma
VPGAGVKQLNKRIRSVKNTQQITKAMKMVAAAKLQRSQGKMLAARPYTSKLTDLMRQLAGAADARHPLFEVRPVQRRLYLVITSDKGLCGAYNMNILRLARQAIDATRDAGVECEVYTIGKKAGDFFAKRGYAIFDRHDDFGGEATAERGQRVGDRLVQAFVETRFDEVRIVHAHFISTMRQVPVDVLLLPIAPERAAEQDTGPVRDYIWEPGQQEIFDLLVPLYLRNRVFMTLMESFTSEHAARMTSMTAATDNAGELIDFLTLRRNRERQAAITAELLDIVGGANAL